MAWLPTLVLMVWIVWGVGRWARGDRPWVRDVAGWGLIGLAVLGFHWRVIVGDAFVPADGGDMASFLYPNFVFNARALRHALIPLWNPYVYGGYPYVGDVQSGVYYPLNWPFFLLGTIRYATLEGLSIWHMWWAGIGTYMLVRALRPDGRPPRRVAAVLAGTVFALSDVFLVHFGNENLNAAISWLPWILWAATAVHEHGRRWGYPASALFLGLSLLAGHPQMALYAGLTLAAYIILEGLTSPDRGRVTFWVRRGGPWVLVALLAGGMAAVVLLPGWELTRLSERARWTYGAAVGYSFAPGQFIGLLVPGFLGRGAQLYWGVWPRVEVGYVGVATLFLALLGGLRYWGKQAVLWGGLALLAFFVSLGAYAPVHGWLTALFPPLQVVRAPARLLVVTDLGLAVLAALGLHALLCWDVDAQKAVDRIYPWLRGAAVVTLALLWPLLMLGLLFSQGQDRVLVVRQAVAANAVGLFLLFLLLTWGVWAGRREGRLSPTTTAWALVLLIVVDLAATGAYVDLGGVDPTARYDRPALVHFLTSDPGPFRVESRTGIEAHWLPNTGMVWGFEDVNGVSNPLVPAATRRFLQRVGGWDSPLYPLLNTKYLIAGKEPPFDIKRFPPVFTEDPQLNVYLNPRTLPRAFLVRRIHRVDTQEEAWEALSRPSFDPAREAVVEGGHPLPPAEDALTGSPDRLAFIHRSLNAEGLAVRVHSPALLVLTEFWYPGWRVSVRGADGRLHPRPLLRVDAALRGVLLTPEDREVWLRFRPRSWLWGGGISGASSLILLLWLGLSLRGRERKQRRGLE